jgi:hypothetical protein
MLFLTAHFLRRLKIIHMMELQLMYSFLWSWTIKDIQTVGQYTIRRSDSREPNFQSSHSKSKTVTQLGNQTTRYTVNQTVRQANIWLQDCFTARHSDNIVKQPDEPTNNKRSNRLAKCSADSVQWSWEHGSCLQANWPEWSNPSRGTLLHLYVWNNKILAAVCSSPSTCGRRREGECQEKRDDFCHNFATTDGAAYGGGG